MSIPDKQLVRIAGKICDQLSQFQRYRRIQAGSRLAVVESDLASIMAMQRKLQICESRGWAATANRLIQKIMGTARGIPYHLSETQQAIQACDAPIPSLIDIHQELMQANEEFDELIYHREDDLLAVQTDPIELNEIYLGPFEIQLHIPDLAEMRYNRIYRVVALDPHPATSNESVTHPHVNDERLCEGDAGAAIHAALTGGRICDFFLLIRSVLNQYNPGSPYVSLDNWGGTPCYECGYVTSGDDLYWCDCCEHEFCSECTSCCNRCDEITCRGCLSECRVCGELICRACMTICPECGEQLCLTCHDEHQCPCLEERKDEDDSNDDQTREATSEQTAQGGDENLDVLRQAARATATTVGIDPA